jgi:four helix bundle protein
MEVRVARTRFEDLRIYQLSEMVADEIWGFVRRWDNFAKDTVGKQLVRSADSIGANIAEGVGRGTYKDNRHFARTARGSLNETKHWLRRAFRREQLDQRVIDKLKPLIDELAPKLNAYLRYLNNQAAAGERRRATPTTTTHD